MQYSISFPGGTVNYQFQNAVETIAALHQSRDCIFITDENIAALYPTLLKNKKTITIPSGEQQKSLATIEKITTQLIQHKAHRKSLIVGVGGGVITDITGFIASIYMRGVDFGFVPTTLLGMVDASIGGKNGVSLGVYKNMLGTITQPEFILFDPQFLETLPDKEWSNGFAEIIKYACIFDAGLFDKLDNHDIKYYRKMPHALSALIEKCVDWKNKTVLEDEHEKGNRKLLNFGHTAGHAIEKLHNIPHGRAVAIGMVIACSISEKVTRLDKGIRTRLVKLLQQYNLPVSIQMNINDVMDILRMDKKSDAQTVDYILLKNIGGGVIHPLTFDTITESLTAIAHAGNS